MKKLKRILKAISVLIESDWNLKKAIQRGSGFSFEVLIESDWNLKQDKEGTLIHYEEGINRIRLEFKEETAQALKDVGKKY